jgi:hypothetical protein
MGDQGLIPNLGRTDLKIQIWFSGTQLKIIPGDNLKRARLERIKHTLQVK